MMPLVETFPDKLLRTSDELECAACAGRPLRIQTVNLHHLALAKRSARFRHVIETADLVTADGWPVVSALRSIGIAADRVTGADLVANMTKFGVGQPLRLGVLGSTVSIVDQWSGALSSVDVAICFREHGDKADWSLPEITRLLHESDVSLLVVAVTPPFGDQIASELALTGFRGTIVPVGGAIDMFVAPARRAPVRLQRLKLEWAYRLLLEPRRLGRRYVVECLPVLFIDLLPSIVSSKIRRLLGTCSSKIRYWRLP